MKNDIPLLSVAQVNSIADEILSNLTVRVIGELDERFDISRGYGMGNLSDEEASIAVFIPYEVVKKNKEVLQPGQKIVAEGRLGIYVPYGKFSLTVSNVEIYGEGILQKEFEKLKKKLAEKGYFAEERKRKIPDYPQKIGVITSASSAAWRDFKKHVTSEYRGLEIILHDALMQGAYSADSITAAFERLKDENPDLIVLTRGGGSLQDLMSFNSEKVVEAVVGSPAPVITAIGHEIDITLADLAADVYVSTPTKAAEVISGKYASFRQKLSDCFNRLRKAQLYYQSLPIQLENVKKSIVVNMEILFKDKAQNLNKSYSRLKLLSPRGTLRRGYSITYTQDGRIVRSAEDISVNDLIRTRVYKGEFKSAVCEKGN